MFVPVPKPSLKWLWNCIHDDITDQKLPKYNRIHPTTTTISTSFNVSPLSEVNCLDEKNNGVENWYKWRDKENRPFFNRSFKYHTNEVIHDQSVIKKMTQNSKKKNSKFLLVVVREGTPDHLLLDWSPKIGPLISRWELDKFKNCLNKSFRTSKIVTLLYQQFSNSLISQQEMSGSRLGALSNNRWLGGMIY